MIKRALLPPIIIGTALTVFALAVSPIIPGFLPHAVCLLGDWRLIGPLMVSDIIIWACYMAIPAIIWIDYKRLEVPKWMAVAYMGFIFFCGIGHLIDAIAYFSPIYTWKAICSVITAGVSVMTVVGLSTTREWMRRPSRDELNALIASLQQAKADVEEIEHPGHSVREGVRKATASIDALMERLESIESSLVAGKA